MEERDGTNLPGHTPTQSDLRRGFFPIFLCLRVAVLVDHVKHYCRSKFVVRLATTLGCLEDVDGVPGTNAPGR